MPIRWRLVLAIGVPLVIVYAAMVVLLANQTRARNVARLEATSLERVDFLAGWIDDRLESAAKGGSVADALASLHDRVPGVREASGSFLVMDSAGVIRYDSDDRALEGRRLEDLLAGLDRPDLEDALLDAASGRSGLVRLPGLISPEVRWIGYAPLPSIRGVVFVSVPESEILAFSRSQLRYGITLLTIGLLLIVAVVFVMASHIARPISHLARAVGILGDGDLDARVHGVESGDEIGDLASAFNRMVADLRTHVDALKRETAAREVVESEFRVARKIQRALLPKRLPSGDRFELATHNDPARHVAGDFYDAFAKGAGFVFVVADVSGKGLPSALFMAASKTVLQRSLTTADSLAEAVTSASDALEREEVGSMYLTAFVGHYEPETGRLRYVNAGHPPPWVRGRDGRVTPLGEPTGGPIGLLPGRTFEERESVLPEGSSLFVFTDGVPEACRADGEFYGDERLREFLGSGLGDGPAEAACRALAAEIDSFQSGAPADDVTILVLRRESSTSSAGSHPPTRS